MHSVQTFPSPKREALCCSRGGLGGSPLQMSVSATDLSRILLIFPCSTSATYAGKLVPLRFQGDPTASSCSVAVTRVAPSVLIFFQQ